LFLSEVRVGFYTAVTLEAAASLNFDVWNSARNARELSSGTYLRNRGRN
jgi:hypothetical protein